MPGLVRLLAVAVLFSLTFFVNHAPTYALQHPSIHLRDPVTWRETLAGGRVALVQGSEQRVPPYKWVEEWYNGMPVDHFSFGDKRTFRLRYFINTDHTVEDGPIFFYTGNEGSLESFALNTGFMWDIAPEFNATVVFAEHRFYGKTKPFGNDSYKSLQNLGYLSSEQALADFAQLIDYLKRERLPNAKHSAVIAFGGSYGGMLTAWIRIKYPHLVQGGIAASAPVFWFRQSLPADDIFDRIVTRTFRNSGCNTKSVLASFRAIEQLAETPQGRAFINNHFHLANESQLTKPEDAARLLAAIQGVMETLAMVDYPYEANFLAPLPAWPIRVACRNFTSKEKKSVEDDAMASYALLNLFYNSTGQLTELCVFENCPGPFSELGDPDGWLWQTCTEMTMVVPPGVGEGHVRGIITSSPHISANVLEGASIRLLSHHLSMAARLGKRHLRTSIQVISQPSSVLSPYFPFRHLNYTTELLRPDWTLINYGTRYPTATNIVFSNGYLDPWSGGGWSLKPTTDGSLVGLIVEDGAHHLDLRGSHPSDTGSVKEVRKLEITAIRRWIKEYRG